MQTFVEVAIIFKLSRINIVQNVADIRLPKYSPSCCGCVCLSGSRIRQRGLCFKIGVEVDFMTASLSSMISFLSLRNSRTELFAITHSLFAFSAVFCPFAASSRSNCEKVSMMLRSSLPAGVDVEAFSDGDKSKFARSRTRSVDRNL